MKAPPNNHANLWNDMSKEERERLMPHVMESQLLHIWQCKQKAISAHKRHMAELDEWMGSIRQELDKIRSEE